MRRVISRLQHGMSRAPRRLVDDELVARVRRSTYCAPRTRRLTYGSSPPGARALAPGGAVERQGRFLGVSGELTSRGAPAHAARGGRRTSFSTPRWNSRTFEVLHELRFGFRRVSPRSEAFHFRFPHFTAFSAPPVKVVPRCQAVDEYPSRQLPLEPHVRLFYLRIDANIGPRHARRRDTPINA